MRPFFPVLEEIEAEEEEDGEEDTGEDVPEKLPIKKLLEVSLLGHGPRVTQKLVSSIVCTDF